MKNQNRIQKVEKKKFVETFSKNQTNLHSFINLDGGEGRKK
jgi:hypothetical protein